MPPQKAHFVWAIKNQQLILYKKIIAVISESYKTHQQTTVCGHNGEFLNINTGGT